MEGKGVKYSLFHGLCGRGSIDGMCGGSSCQIRPGSKGRGIVEELSCVRVLAIASPGALFHWVG